MKKVTKGGRLEPTGRQYVQTNDAAELQRLRTVPLWHKRMEFRCWEVLREHGLPDLPDGILVNARPRQAVDPEQLEWCWNDAQAAGGEAQYMAKIGAGWQPTTALELADPMVFIPFDSPAGYASRILREYEYMRRALDRGHSGLALEHASVAAFLAGEARVALWQVDQRRRGGITRSHRYERQREIVKEAARERSADLSAGRTGKVVNRALAMCEEAGIKQPTDRTIRNWLRDLRRQWESEVPPNDDPGASRLS